MSSLTLVYLFSLFMFTLVLFLLLHLLHFWCGWWLLSVGSSLREQPGPGPTTVGRLSPHFPSHRAPYGGMRAISPLPKWARGILSDFVMTSLEFIDKKKMLLNGIRSENMFSTKGLISYFEKCSSISITHGNPTR